MKTCRKTKPFVVNNRGVLIHRVKHLAQYKLGNNRPHLAVKMWCGQGQNGQEKFTFTDAPPPTRMVCAACEAAIAEAGLPSAADLAGRPVVIGRVKAVFVDMIYPTEENLND